ncbi:MAG: hypothetical protein V1720_07280 [bacterium]
MKKYFVIIAISLLVAVGCSILKTISNISRLKFKLENVTDFKVSGISINNKTALKDFNTVDIVKLTAAVAKGEMPVTFILNVDAKNPNDGSGGYPATDISIKSFAWKLFVDQKETISGNISSPVSVPGKGESKVIPLEIKFDLFYFFKDKGFESLMNLALNLGGAKGSASQLKLIAEPVLGTPIGDLKYPEPITIVSQQFN